MKSLSKKGIVDVMPLLTFGMGLLALMLGLGIAGKVLGKLEASITDNTSADNIVNNGTEALNTIGSFGGIIGLVGVGAFVVAMVSGLFIARRR